MPTVYEIANMVRRLIGVPYDAVVAPKTLALAVGLQPKGTTSCRVGLAGCTLFYNHTIDPELQGYQIARAACAHALRLLGFIRDVSPHDLAVELCGVGLVVLASVHQL